LTENVINDAGINDRPIANIKEDTTPSIAFSIFATPGGSATGTLSTVITILLLPLAFLIIA